MRERLSTEAGRKPYALRETTIEPVFGQIKYNRRIDQFMRRGRAAVQSELRLVAATHNMLKLHNHWIADSQHRLNAGVPLSTSAERHRDPRAIQPLCRTLTLRRNIAASANSRRPPTCAFVRPWPSD